MTVNQVVFTYLGANPSIPTNKAIAMKRGRSAELIVLRDKKLAERFTYWYFHRKLRLDIVLEILEKQEFFISKQRIWAIVQKKRGLGTDEAIRQSKRKITLYSGDSENIFPTKD